MDKCGKGLFYRRQQLGRTPRARLRAFLREAVLWAGVAGIALLAIPFGLLRMLMQLVGTAADRLAACLDRGSSPP